MCKQNDTATRIHFAFIYFRVLNEHTRTPCDTLHYVELCASWSCKLIAEADVLRSYQYRSMAVEIGIFSTSNAFLSASLHSFAQIRNVLRFGQIAWSDACKNYQTLKSTNENTHANVAHLNIHWILFLSHFVSAMLYVCGTVGPSRCAQWALRAEHK